MSETISANKVVTISYVLRSDEGDVIDTSEGRQPLVYLHGARNIVPGLEEQLEGAAVGASIQAIVPPEKGYGPRRGEPREIARDLFPEEADLRAGMHVLAHDEEGREFPFFIVDVTDQTVTIDPNHPLAGQTLHFEAKVVELRDATAEEIDDGHPYGPDGQPQ